MVLETLIPVGVTSLYILLNGYAYALGRGSLPRWKSERLNGWPLWKDASKTEKAFYVMTPGIYANIRKEKMKRAELEESLTDIVGTRDYLT